MASYHTTIPDPEALFVCPYDKVHMIKHKKMQYHLAKCRKNHPNRPMKVCHFNARHEVAEEEYRFHLATCPDKHTVERLHSSSRQQDWVKGNTDVPTYFPDVLVPDINEDWDCEVTVPRIGVPARDMAGIGYYKSLVGLKRAQKKAYYDNQLKGDDDANVALIAGLSAADEELNPAAAATAAEPTTTSLTDPPRPFPVSTFAQPTLGRGRGSARLSQKGQVTPGTPSSPSSPSSPSDGYDKFKLIRRVKKKLTQIGGLVQRQAAGELLNEEERVKVALKTTLCAQLAALEEQVANSPN